MARFTWRGSTLNPSSLELDPEEAELREKLRWQCTIVDAISAYVETVGAAFETLSEAQKQLAEAGIDIRDWPSDPLLDRLREASGYIAKAAAATREPLKKMRGTLQACFHDLSLADSAAMELKKHSQYQQKLEAVIAEKQTKAGSPEDATRSKGIFGRCRGKPNAQNSSSTRESGTESTETAGVKRNREKVDHWSDEMNLRQSRAKDLVLACLSRRDQLVDNVRDIAHSVVKAVGVMSGTRPVIEFEPSHKPQERPWVFSFCVTLPELPSTRQLELVEAMAREMPSGGRCLEEAVLEVDGEADHRSIVEVRAERDRQMAEDEMVLSRGLLRSPVCEDTGTYNKSQQAARGAEQLVEQAEERLLREKGAAELVNEGASSDLVQKKTTRRPLSDECEDYSGGARQGHVLGASSDVVQTKTGRLLSDENEALGEGVFHLKIVTQPALGDDKFSPSNEAPTSAGGDSGLIDEDTSDALLADVKETAALALTRKALGNGMVGKYTLNDLLGNDHALEDPLDDLSIPEESKRSLLRWASVCEIEVPCPCPCHTEEAEAAAQAANAAEAEKQRLLAATNQRVKKTTAPAPF